MSASYAMGIVLSDLQVLFHNNLKEWFYYNCHLRESWVIKHFPVATVNKWQNMNMLSAWTVSIHEPKKFESESVILPSPFPKSVLRINREKDELLFRGKSGQVYELTIPGRRI